jgi:replicative DNA helicase
MVKQTALRLACSGVPAAIISLEEQKPKIGRNILAAEARVENHKLRRPSSLSEQEWHEVDEGITRLGGVPLYLVDRARRLPDIAAELTLLVASHGVRMVVVDYLQRVQAGGRDAYERAGLASVGLSDLFKDLNVAGFVPVQLNRNPEGRDDKRPTMADLRDSGQLEQDADGILFLHREDYYHSGDPAYVPTGVAELSIGKWRDGVRGKVVKLQSNLKYQTFQDVDNNPFP